MRKFAFLRLVAFALLTASITTLTGRARATIVVSGKTVSEWPESVLRESTPGTPFDTAGVLATKLFPHPSGVVRGLTILVDFSDRAGAYSKAEIDAWLNTQGYQRFGLTGSIRDYYLKQSNGAVDYQNEVHGFYRAKKTKSYYQGGDGYERADELWGEVTAALDAEIDYSKFDNDHDGKTEAISVLYAGDEGSFGKGLWPHASTSSDQRDGVRLDRYMMTAMDEQPTNYVFAHESGHMLFGWPDLYGVGDYSIMANRGANTNPVGVDDVLRADQGWVDLLDIQSTTNARYEATPNGVVYRYLNPARPTEYFLWSNVQNVGEWQSLAGGGLLIWHFDHSIKGNDPPQTLELAVVQGGGTRQLSATQWPSPGSAKTDFFAKGVNTEFAATTKPASQWNDGSASGLRIYDIGASGPTMAFSVGVGPIAATGDAGSGAMGGASGGAAAQGGSSTLGGSGSSVGGSSGSGAAGVASSSNGTAGVAGAPTRSVGGASNAAGAASGAVGSPPSSDRTGCSCSTTRRPSSSRAIALAFATLLLLSRRRRTAR